MGKMRSFSSLVLAGLVGVSVLASGCGKELALEDWGKVEEGMTLQQVQRILGEGTKVTSEEVASRLGQFDEVEAPEEACDTWIRWGNRQGYGFAGFKDDKVQELFYD
jgi:hypothetical protein